MQIILVFLDEWDEYFNFWGNYMPLNETQCISAKPKYPGPVKDKQGWTSFCLSFVLSDPDANVPHFCIYLVFCALQLLMIEVLTNCKAVNYTNKNDAVKVKSLIYFYIFILFYFIYFFLPSSFFPKHFRNSFILSILCTQLWCSTEMLCWFGWPFHWSYFCKWHKDILLSCPNEGVFIASVLL